MRNRCFFLCVQEISKWNTHPFTIYYLPFTLPTVHFFPSRQVALDLLGFQVHWYGIMYLLAFVVAYVLIFRFQKFRSLNLTKDDIGSILSWAVVGVLVGGRLGYVLFYDPAYFAAHPLEVFAVWQGGMASHGGFIGTGLALWYILRKKGVPILAFFDVAVVPIAVGLALGRFGNFINWELYGTVTDVPWAVQIPGVEGLRHPTFFYSMIKDAWIAACCLVLLRSGKGRTGDVLALFLVLYGVLRFIVEHFREPTHSLVSFGFFDLSRGQVLSVPVVLLGIAVCVWLRR